MTAPPVSFMGVPRRLVMSEGKLMLNLTETGQKLHHLRATLSCTDLATDLGEGGARPLRVLDCQALCS